MRTMILTRKQKRDREHKLWQVENEVGTDHTDFNQENKKRDRTHKLWQVENEVGTDLTDFNQENKKGTEHTNYDK
jgi:hypothetical protein